MARPRWTPPLSAALFSSQFLAFIATAAAAAVSPENHYSGIIYGAGSYGTLQTLCFMFAALWGDIMLVRASLFSAYILLVTNMMLGMPDITVWTAAPGSYKLLGGAIALNCVALSLHGLAFFQMLFDERPIKLANDTEEAVWRFFLRRCGMKRLEARQILKLGHIQKYAAGDVIYDREVPGSTLALGLVVEGRANLRVRVNGNAKAGPTSLTSFTAVEAKGRSPHNKLGAPEYERYVCSGELTGMRMLNLFGIYVGFEALETCSIVADKPLTLVTWDVDAVTKMASGAAGFAVPGYWRSFALFTVSAAFAMHEGVRPHNHMGEDEVDGWEMGAMSSDFSAPLTEEEQAEVRPPFKSYLWWLVKSLSPLQPPGMRHNAVPLGGAKVRERLASAHRQASEKQTSATEVVACEKV